MTTEIKIIRCMGHCLCARHDTSRFEVEIGGFKWRIKTVTYWSNPTPVTYPVEYAVPPVDDDGDDYVDCLVYDEDGYLQEYNLPVKIKCVPSCGKRALWRCEAKVGIVVIRKYSEPAHMGQWKETFSFDRTQTTRVFNGSYISEEPEDDDEFHVELTLQITKTSRIIDLSIPENEFIREPSDALRITVDGNNLYLSKWFLSHHSQFFLAMFEDDFMEKRTGSYVLREIDFTEFLRFLAILHGKRRYVDESFQSQLTMADMYQCDYVFQKCLQYSDRSKADYYRTLFPAGQEEKAVHVYTIPMTRPFFKHVVEVGGFKWLFRSPGIGEAGVKMRVWCKKSDMKNTMLWNCAVKGKFEVKSLNNNSDGQDKRHKIFSRIWNMYSYGSFSLKYGEVQSFDFAKYARNTVHFSLEILESFVIDLSSPTNELIGDPSDAVCLAVEKEMLYLSKYSLSIHCPISLDVGLDEFLLFIAVLHDKNVPIHSYVAKKLNKLTTMFGCSFDYWFAQQRLKGCW
ncbi:hypothetical protein QR680_011523 [Steinernema hermaphroditum]|uniref:BTB domain-containing protein n=1 Tax=Steinernema hermaphroditum TaxID=289476 RepID=A0AA39HYU8_9BILA|nr:hypothetical protein QR680_011523 [Steinernema hermaphroditum]